MKIKVLMIDIGGWGGITHYTYNLMQELAVSGGVECLLLTDRNYELDGLSRNFKVTKVAFNNQPYILAVSRLLRIVVSYKPGIIHVQTMFSARKDWFLFLLAKLGGAKVVITAHNVLPHEDREKRAFFMSGAFKIIYYCSKAVIAHSNFSRDKLMRFFGMDSGKIRVIPHGNYLFFRTKEISREDAREKLGIALDKKLILHFGALRHYKGIDVLLKAMKMIREKQPDILLLLAGKPMHLPERYFQDRIQKQGLDGSVVLKAEYIPLEAIQVFFYASDLVVLPYKEIDTSGSIQLAYAFSKPVIASRSGSMLEVVDEAVNGLLVKPDDPQALAEAIEGLLFEPEKLISMGKASFELAQDKFSWKKIAVSTVNLYQDIMAA